MCKNARLELALIVLVFALVSLYLSRSVVTHGLTLDGTVYAGIAKSLANDIGNFWRLPSFLANHEFFNHHPPLGIWLESLWFKLLGDHFWTEKTFGALTLFVTMVLLVMFWRAISTARIAWLPVVLLALMPVTMGTFENVFLEVSLTNFTTLAVLMSFISVKRLKQNEYNWPWLILAGVFVAGAVLVKGPVGMFPLVAVPIFAFGQHPISPLTILRHSSIPLIVVVLVILALVSSDLSFEAFERYWHSQIDGTLSGRRLPDHGRLYVLEQLARNLALPLFICLMAYLWGNKKYDARKYRTQGFRFFIIAFSASLPLMISPRQYSHYLMPALPFFALALSLLITPSVEGIVTRLEGVCSRIWLVIVCLFAVSATLAAIHYGQIGEDVKELEDIKAIRRAAPDAKIIAFCDKNQDESTRMAYLYRYYSVKSYLVRRKRSLVPYDYIVCSKRPVGNAKRQGSLHGKLRLWRSDSNT